MKFGPVAVDRARGKILGHNVAGPDGRRLLRKGRPLSAGDVEALRALGRDVVYVAEPEPGDVGENEAAQRVARAAAGASIAPGAAAAGRVNLFAAKAGVLRVQTARALRINLSEGISLATLPPHAPVSARQIVGTVKVIPYAVAEKLLRRVEAAARAGGPLLSIDLLRPRRVALILSGGASVRDRVLRDFEPPLRARVESLGSVLASSEFVPLQDESGEALLAEALARQAKNGAQLILLAGETAIVDARDIAPRAIRRAGGEVAGFGAPVDPGNLLLVGYLGAIPVIGAPGCARSRKVNVIDWVLPRLLVGERLKRRDIAALGVGGLLEDFPERPMPRSARPSAQTPPD